MTYNDITLLQELSLGNAVKRGVQATRNLGHDVRKAVGASPRTQTGVKKVRYSFNDKMAAAKASFKDSRDQRFQDKIASRSDAAEDEIGRGNSSGRPGSKADLYDKRKAARAAAAVVPDPNDRTMTRDQYQDQRRRERAIPGSPTTKLVPLAQVDEMKVRQLLQRLNPDQAAQFADMVGTLVSNLMRQNIHTAAGAARESIGTFKDNLLVEVEGDAGDRALQTLMKWANQLSRNPGKIGTFAMLALGELQFSDEAQRQKFRKTIEKEFGRYVASATDKPVKRMTKTAVKQRGREAGDEPKFKTRQDARDFARDQNTFRRTRKVADAGKGVEDRWRAPTV